MKRLTLTLTLRASLLVALMATTSALHAQTCTAGNGALKVTSFPSGANVSIDGVDTGRLTPMSISLTGGDHTVVVSIPNSGWNPDYTNCMHRLRQQ